MMTELTIAWATHNLSELDIIACTLRQYVEWYLQPWDVAEMSHAQLLELRAAITTAAVAAAAPKPFARMHATTKQPHTSSSYSLGAFNMFCHFIHSKLSSLQSDAAT